MSRFAPLATLLLLGACVAPSAPPPAPAPRPAPRPVPVAPPAAPVPADWRDWPRTPGDWRWQPGSASYGVAGAAPMLLMRCQGGQVVLAVPGARGPAVEIRTTSTSRSVAATPAAGGGVEARIGARDPILDAMGFSRGRFAVVVPPATRLVVPAWAEVLRLVEDCRG